MSALVEVKNLRRTFDVSKPWLERVLGREGKLVVKAVDGVTFNIPKGTTFALVGESGSGKSTVARMVAGLLPPSGGTISIDGVALDKKHGYPKSLRRRLQMIFHDRALDGSRGLGGLAGGDRRTGGGCSERCRPRRSQRHREAQRS